MPATYLRCHPTTPCAVVERIAVDVAWEKDGSLTLDYRIIGDLSHLLLPAAQAPCPADNLWQHTCCEAFIAAVDTPEYREFNLSPSGQWAAYQFIDYRQRNPAFAAPDAPRITLHPLADGCRLVATLPADLLPIGPSLQLGLSAVIETCNGDKSYWALTHTAPQPDFHRRATFTYSLHRP